MNHAATRRPLLRARLYSVRRTGVEVDADRGPVAGGLGFVVRVGGGDGGGGGVVRLALVLVLASLVSDSESPASRWRCTLVIVFAIWF